MPREDGGRGTARCACAWPCAHASDAVLNILSVLKKKIDAVPRPDVPHRGSDVIRTKQRRLRPPPPAPQASGTAIRFLQRLSHISQPEAVTGRELIRPGCLHSPVCPAELGAHPGPMSTCSSFLEGLQVSSGDKLLPRDLAEQPRPARTMAAGHTERMGSRGRPGPAGLGLRACGVA